MEMFLKLMSTKKYPSNKAIHFELLIINFILFSNFVYMILKNNMILDLYNLANIMNYESNSFQWNGELFWLYSNKNFS